MDILQNMGCDIRVLQIYGAKDPDEFIIKYGPERFQKCVDSAISLVEFKVKILKQGLNLDNVNDKIKFLNEIAKILSKVDNKIENEVYIEKISKEYGISKEAIYAEVNKLIYDKKSDKKILERNPVKAYIKKENIAKVDEAIIKREKLVIYILVNYPKESFAKIKDTILVQDIKDEINTKIISKIYEQYSSGQIGDIISLFEEEEIVNYLSGIMAEDFEIVDLNKCIDDLLNTYNKEKLLTTRNDIIKKLEDTSNLTEEEIRELEKRLNDVILRLAKVK